MWCGCSIVAAACVSRRGRALRVLRAFRRFLASLASRPAACVGGFPPPPSLRDFGASPLVPRPPLRGHPIVVRLTIALWLGFRAQHTTQLAGILRVSSCSAPLRVVGRSGRSGTAPRRARLASLLCSVFGAGLGRCPSLFHHLALAALRGHSCCHRCALRLTACLTKSVNGRFRAHFRFRSVKLR